MRNTSHHLRALILAGSALLATLLVLAGALAPANAKPRKAAPEESLPALAQVTFSGFQASPGGGGRLWVYLTAEPKYRVAESKDRLVITLERTDVGVANNKNPLNLEPFSVAVLRSQLFVRGSDVDWVLTVKPGTKLEPRFVESAAAPVVLQIELPAEAPSKGE